MGQKVQSKIENCPDYKLIYQDMVSKKYPDKVELCNSLFLKDSFSALDILKINQILFGVLNKGTTDFNQKHKSYDKTSILEILNYQKKYKLNNSQLAIHFKLSRNTVTNWKSFFLNS